MNKRAYLIDSSIYVFRGWHVFDDAITDRDGNPTNAVYGFTEFLYQLFEQKQPEFIACAFDAHQTNSYRREIFPEYKANRPPAPEELIVQFRYCREFCRAMGIPEFGSNRFEADDIIGTLATRLRDEGFDITIVTADKDLTQLVLGERDAWWDFARGNVLNHKGVEKQFGVKPEKIADMLALAGDKVDNIPGIPGVGYKMASNLLNKFDNVDDILNNIENISKMKFRGSARIQNLVEEHQGLLPTNKRLTEIVTDAVFDNHDQHILWQGIPDEETFHELFDKLNVSDQRRKRWLQI
ncbi:MAG: flap endonuclease [endosymbiont of Galathealinum brachiosum]|uniref:Flap endonuclease n=1 Tax=endosymbiont of Galathealinum brachiosum TaxID=2200906 RepID=A0A370DD60_9GAMM|nr:MAG: flap endonuclease [endosymbiont of Galathealinum brachiosum]